MLNENFFELFGLLEKQQSPRQHIRCCIFNTRVKKVVIVSSVIAKIFNPMQVLDGHISTLLLLNQCLLLLLLVATASYLLFDFCSVLFVTVIQYSILLFRIFVAQQIFSSDLGNVFQVFRPP